MNNLIQSKIEQSNTVLVPKGENRARTIGMLQQCGVALPEFVGRCLHRDYRW